MSLFLSLDPETMLIMIVISSFLQACVLIALGFVANQYKGISLYVIGTVMASLSFIIGLLTFSWEVPPLKFITNTFIIGSRVIWAIAIGQFLGRKTTKFTWIVLATTLLTSQVYHNYIATSYNERQFFMISLNIIICATTISYILKAKHHYFGFTVYSLVVVFSADILLSSFRGLLILDGKTQSLIDASFANLLTFMTLFVIDFLRNGFFVLMVSQRMYLDLKLLSETDFLTQIFNRGAVTERVNKTIKNKKNYPLTLILVDIDYFKNINDTYGHDVGDIVLKSVVSLLQTQLHPQDLIGRWGGEEFLIVLPNCSASDVRDSAELLRHTVEKTAIAYSPNPNERIHCTLSLGVVTATQPKVTLNDLLKPADLALYEAKNSGRNQAQYIVFSR